MSREMEDLFKRMLDLLPCLSDEYKKSIEENGEILGTVIIEDVFMPEVIKLLNEDNDIELLKNIFNWFEEIANSKNLYLINILSITVLEILGNDKTILEVAQKYMGSKTKQLQIEADKYLGRNN